MRRLNDIRSFPFLRIRLGRILFIRRLVHKGNCSEFETLHGMFELEENHGSHR